MALFVPKRLQSSVVASLGIFEVHQHEVTSPRGGSWNIYTIEIADWVSVAAVTKDGRLVLVRQHRLGIEDMTVETAGGLVDEGESPEVAALRELHEETGWQGRSAESLGWVHPNPAMQRNRCHLFLVRDVIDTGTLSPDTHESTEPVVWSVDEVERALTSNELTHSIAVLTLHRALQRIRGGA